VVDARYLLPLLPAPMIWAAAGLTLLSFWRQQFHYGRGAFHFHRLRALRSGQRARLEPRSFYSGLLLHPLTGEAASPGEGGPMSRLLTTGLLVVSQAAVAAGYLWEKEHPVAGIRLSPSA
jgi:hypothetical protein